MKVKRKDIENTKVEGVRIKNKRNIMVFTMIRAGRE